jgi:hypothetical protein
VVSIGLQRTAVEGVETRMCKRCMVLDGPQRRTAALESLAEAAE